jgi:hypothetical protein
MSHILGKNKKTTTPKYMVFFDSESFVDTDINNKEEGQEVVHDCYLVIARFTTKRKEYKTDERIYRRDKDEHFKNTFYDDLDRYTKSKNKTWCFAHNMRYDILVTGGIKYLIKLGYKVTAFSESNPFFMCFENEDTNKKIIMVSSTNYYQFSLAKLGKCFGLEKLDIEYKDTDIEESITYCKRDVEILQKAMLNLIEFIKEEDLGNFKFTIAGQSFNAYRHRFMNTEIYIHRNKESVILERESYAGGRTESWRIGTYNNLYYVDINSMYPSEMLEQRYPTKLLSYRKRMSINDLNIFIKNGFLVTAKVVVKTEEPAYFKKEGKLIFPTGEFETVLSTPELIHAIENNHIVKIKETNIYEGEYIFKEYVNYFYNKRLEAKANLDEVRTLLYKLFLNCLYGKFGQTSICWEKIDEAPADEVRQEFVLEAETNQRYLVKIFGGGVFREVKKEIGESEAKDSFCAIASHVTSYARMKLWKYIKQAGTENIYYMDTDSLITNIKGYNKLNEYIDNDKLGYLKLEDYIEEIHLHGAKDYKYKNKKGEITEKIKGIGIKNSKRITENEFMCTQWRGLSKSLKEGNLEGYSNNIIKKNLTRKYSKGDIQESGKVIPFNLDYEELIEG